MASTLIIAAILTVAGVAANAAPNYRSLQVEFPGGIQMWTAACNVPGVGMGWIVTRDDKRGCAIQKEVKGQLAYGVVWDKGDLTDIQAFTFKDFKPDELYQRRSECVRYNIKTRGPHGEVRTIHTMEYDQCMDGQPVAEMAN
ncbi:MAG: hypothetical protein JSS14_23245 [Proteobacteria bacterium]|nr:hypothetical protein [Pseudomonadota bacterium]